MAEDTKKGGLIMANPYETEVKRKALAGIKLTNPTPQATALYNSFKPQVKVPAVNNQANVDAEIKRKAGLGIALTNATPEAMAKYGEFQAAPIKNEFMSGIQDQLAAMAGEREAAKQAADYQVQQNNAYLQNQLGALKEQNALDVDAAQQLQNRRGGFYSGGLDYQLGNIGRGYAQSQGALQNDIAARNAQIMSQYGNQANTIASQIANLQKTAPDILRNKIEDYLQNQSGITGMYRGAPTYSAKQDQLNRAAQEQERADILAQQKFENNLATNKYNLDVRQENRIASGGGSSGSGGSSKSGGDKVTTNQFNDVYATLNKRYGIAHYKTDKDGNYVTNPDGSAITTYTNPTNIDQKAKLIIEILNSIPSDDQALKMLNKFGITEEEAHKIVGGG